MEPQKGNTGEDVEVKLSDSEVVEQGGEDRQGEGPSDAPRSLWAKALATSGFPAESWARLKAMFFLNAMVV
jgi:hypothetical protein